MQHRCPAVISCVPLAGEQAAHSAVWDDMHIKGPAHVRVMGISKICMQSMLLRTVRLIDPSACQALDLHTSVPGTGPMTDPDKGRVRLTRWRITHDEGLTGLTWRQPGPSGLKLRRRRPG